jgi:hypothetical protein
MRTLLAVLLLHLGASTPAVDVEVLLTSGERAFGGLVSDRNGELVIDRRIWNPHGSMIQRVSWTRSRVARIEVVSSLEDLYRQRAASSEPTYDGQYSLARWCLERGLQDHAFERAKALWDREPSDEVARQLLEDIGYLLDGAQWLSRADYTAKYGLVSWEGRLMSQAEADARNAYAAAVQRIKAAEQRIAELTNASKTQLDELRDTTVTLRREERHWKHAREAADAERRQKMSPEEAADDIADQEERRRFDQAHDVAAAKVEEPKELAQARKAFAAADKAWRKNDEDLFAARSERDAAIVERDAQWAKVTDLAAKAGRKP